MPWHYQIMSTHKDMTQKISSWLWKFSDFQLREKKKKVIQWEILDNIPNNPTNPYDPNNLKYVYQTCIVHKSCQIHANHPNNPNRPMTLITLSIFEKFWFFWFFSPETIFFLSTSPNNPNHPNDPNNLNKYVRGVYDPK